MKNFKTLVSLVLVCASVFGCMIFSTSAASVDGFKDLNKNADYYEAVKWAVDNGYMKGMSDKVFSPNTTLTRAQFATLMAGFEGADLNAYKGKKIFNDVKTNAWFATTAAWAYENGIMSGTGNNNFSPNTVITREQIALLVKNYVGFKGIYLEKVTPEVRLLDRGTKRASAWASEAVEYAYKTDYMQLDEGNRFNPKNKVTRAEAATILYSLNNAIERTEVKHERRFVGYLDLYTSYGNVDFASYDILNLLPVKASGSSKTINDSGLKRFKNIKAQASAENPDLKYILTLTVDSGADIEQWLYPYANCEDFANKTVALVKEYDLDGVDFDYEFPTGAISQKNLEYFLKVLREKLDDLKVEMNKPEDYEYLITMAIPGGLYAFSLYKDLSELQHYVDYFNFMDYDLMIGEARTVAYPHATVYGPSFGYGHGTYDDIIRSLEMGVQRDKIVIGSGTYVQAWRGVEGRYDEELGIWIGLFGTGRWAGDVSTPIASDLGLINYEDNKPINGYYTYFDKDTHSVSWYNPDSKEFRSCDEYWSLEEKCRLINEYNIGGLMLFHCNTVSGTDLAAKINEWMG
ncbi:MAG: S-layer homology domain-containing protein [Clostridia bacterium]|nr:S-layer homology domain-containing protein [Clostridia bacterium]